jgi:hypothetical protein
MSGLDDYLIDPNVSLLSKTPNRQPLGVDNSKPADIARSPIAGCGLAMSLRMRRRPRRDGVFCRGAGGGLSLRRSQIGSCNAEPHPKETCNPTRLSDWL